MNGMIALAIVLYADPVDEPPVVFQACAESRLHVAVQRQDDQSYLVHFHVRYRGLVGKRAFARIRCVVKDGETERTHMTQKEIEIADKDESWKFYLATQRFPELDSANVTYQIEIGDIDRSALDEYQVRDSFAWRNKKGKMFAGSPEERIAIPLLVRVIKIEGGSFRIVTEAKYGAGLTEMRYGIVQGILQPKSASATAEKAK